jgi:hypothetical protein
MSGTWKERVLINEPFAMAEYITERGYDSMEEYYNFMQCADIIKGIVK